MPRRNRSTHADRYAPMHDRGLYPLGELTDISALETLSAHFAERRRRVRMVHSS